ncbi:MAG: hypothetical protein ABFD98_20315 [Syntrophobacteraceae bacterium]|nr:hypothetical protein [Desulfobacteraceae bacterium]
MENREKASAVREFLQEAYPGERVEDRYDAQRMAHTFDITAKGVPHRVIVEEGFLAVQEASSIPGKLKDFTLIEHLRELGSTPLRVTKEGLKLEYE